MEPLESFCGAEGRICHIVNDYNKLLKFMLVYVSLNEFLNVPGRIIAYQSHIFTSSYRLSDLLIGCRTGLILLRMIPLQACYSAARPLRFRAPASLAILV